MKSKPLYYYEDTILNYSFDGFLSQFNFEPNLFGYQHDDPGAVCFDRIIGDFELIYVTGGESIITIANSIYRCHAGDAIIIPPFTRHSIDTPENNPHENYWIHFSIDPVYKQALFVNSFCPNKQYKLIIGVNQNVLSIYKLIKREESECKPFKALYIKSLLLQILIEFVRASDINLASSSSQDYNMNELYIDAAIEYINNNIASSIRITDICGHLHISESTLSKGFAKTLGSSVGKYIRQTKLKYAELLLKTTDKSIKEISEDLGFSSAYHFSAIFKNIYGTSPDKYRHIKNI